MIEQPECYMVCPNCEHIVFEVKEFKFNQLPDDIQCDFCGTNHDVGSILNNIYVRLSEIIKQAKLKNSL